MGVCRAERERDVSLCCALAVPHTHTIGCTHGVRWCSHHASAPTEWLRKDAAQLLFVSVCIQPLTPLPAPPCPPVHRPPGHGLLRQGTGTLGHLWGQQGRRRSWPAQHLQPRPAPRPTPHRVQLTCVCVDGCVCSQWLCEHEGIRPARKHTGARMFCGCICAKLCVIQSIAINHMCVLSPQGL